MTIVSLCCNLFLYYISISIVVLQSVLVSFRQSFSAILQLFVFGKPCKM